MGKARFALLWLTLLILTVGIRALASGRNSEPKTLSAEEIDALHERFLSLPRRTPLLYVPREAESFNGRVRAYMLEHDSGIRRCRSMLVDPDTTPKAYVEVSFNPHGLGADRAALKEVVVERSTIDLGASVEACIVDVFRSFEPRVSASDIPNSRIAFEFCFGNLNRLETQ